jgi:hypothetical protein
MKRDTLFVQLPRESPDSLAAVVYLNFGEEPLIFHPPAIHATADIFLDSLTVEMRVSQARSTIHYTLDRTDPTPLSPEYTGPLTLTSSTVVRAQTFSNNLPVGAVVSRTFTRAVPIPPTSLSPGDPGISFSYYEGTWDSIPKFSQLTPVRQGTVPDVDLRERRRDEFFGFAFEGFLAVPEDGVYRLTLASDDGSRLYLHDSLVVENDGLHAEMEKSSVVPLGHGLHPLRVEYFNKSGGSALRVSVSLAGEQPRPLTDAVLRH